MSTENGNNGTVRSILFCGIGGQGVLKASEVAGWAALYEGYHVRKSEVHGMSQRGGSVESHLRFGKTVYSPLIPEGGADFLVSFFPDEHERMRHFLKPGGIDLAEFLGQAETRVKDKRFRNTFILGALSTYLPIQESTWLRAIEEVFPSAFEENRSAFVNGRNAAQERTE